MKTKNSGFEDSLVGLDRAINDDEDEWKILIKSVESIVEHTIERYMPRDVYVEADDVLQDVFETLLKNDRSALRNLQNRTFSEQRSYLVSIAKSRCLDYGRMSKKTEKVFSREDPEPAIESYEQPDTGFRDKFICERRWTVFPLMLDRLPSAQAEVLKLKSGGCKGREIADKLGIPENTVSSHIKRGIATLKTLKFELYSELCDGAELLERFSEAG